MPIRFFVVDTKNEVIILHVASTQLRSLNILCHNRGTQHRHLDDIRKHFATRKHFHSSNCIPFSRPQHNCMLFSRPYTTVPTLWEHKAMHSIRDLKNMLPHSFNKMGNIPDKYSITLELNVPPVQHGRCRVPIEAKAWGRWYCKKSSSHWWNPYPRWVLLHMLRRLMEL